MLKICPLCHGIKGIKSVIRRRNALCEGLWSRESIDKLRELKMGQNTEGKWWEKSRRL